MRIKTCWLYLPKAIKKDPRRAAEVRRGWMKGGHLRAFPSLPTKCGKEAIRNAMNWE